MRSLYFSSAIALFAFTAAAADYTPPKASFKEIPSGSYELDKTHANLMFSYNHMGYSTYYARFKQFDAKVELDTAHPENSKLSVDINPASVAAASDTMEAKFMSKEFFDTEQFRSATFVSKSIKRTGDHSALITGDLMLHGVTKPVTLNTTLVGAGNNPMMHFPEFGIHATTEVNRSDFGLGSFVPMVSDKVTITIDAEFHQKTEEPKAK